VARQALAQPLLLLDKVLSRGRCIGDGSRLQRPKLRPSGSTSGARNDRAFATQLAAHPGAFCSRGVTGRRELLLELLRPLASSCASSRIGPSSGLRRSYRHDSGALSSGVALVEPAITLMPKSNSSASGEAGARRRRRIATRPASSSTGGPPARRAGRARGLRHRALPRLTTMDAAACRRVPRARVRRRDKLYVPVQSLEASALHGAPAETARCTSSAATSGQSTQPRPARIRDARELLDVYRDARRRGYAFGVDEQQLHAFEASSRSRTRTGAAIAQVIEDLTPPGQWTVSCAATSAR